MSFLVCIYVVSKRNRNESNRIETNPTESKRNETKWGKSVKNHQANNANYCAWNSSMALPMATCRRHGPGTQSSTINALGGSQSGERLIIYAQSGSHRQGVTPAHGVIDVNSNCNGSWWMMIMTWIKNKKVPCHIVIMTQRYCIRLWYHSVIHTYVGFVSPRGEIECNCTYDYNYTISITVAVSVSVATTGLYHIVWQTPPKTRFLSSVWCMILCVQRNLS